MTASWLTWQITWRSALRIFGLGALFGGIYGLSLAIFILNTISPPYTGGTYLRSPDDALVIMVIGAGIGGCIGALIGLVAGILIGLLISAITIRAFLPLHNRSRYLKVIQLSSTITGAIGTLIGVWLLWGKINSEYALTTQITMLALLSGIPALLAGLAIWRASGQVAAWYVRTVAASTPMPARDARISS